MITSLLFGGTFDPFHNGHMHMLGCIQSLKSLNRVLLMPTAQTPHKSAPSTTEKDRLAMLKEILSDLPNREQQPLQYKISEFELHKKTPCYTYETVHALEEMDPKEKWGLLIGSDQYFSFHLWKQFKTLLKKLTLVVVRRDTVARSVYDVYAETTLTCDPDNIIFLHGPPIDISSTTIRETCHNHYIIEGVVPKKIVAYIRHHQLYQKEE